MHAVFGKISDAYGTAECLKPPEAVAGVWRREVVARLLVAHADPWKPCAALGLLPGQHALLQVPALSVVRYDLALTYTKQSCSARPQENKQASMCRICADNRRP